ncbi:hypothetical protein BDZ97DRAFT_453094 [Flammula alnicola]|nr:hypothetical protein BDZ97DRAFT_453094 [Flammula alnicola]
MGDGPDVPRGNRYGTNGRCSTYADFQNALGGHPQIQTFAAFLGQPRPAKRLTAPLSWHPAICWCRLPAWTTCYYRTLAAQSSMTFTQLKRFTLNQAVHVNIEGQGWLLGTVVAFVHAVRALTGTHVKVKYFENGRPHEGVFPDDPNVIRPN